MLTWVASTCSATWMLLLYQSFILENFLKKAFHTRFALAVSGVI